VCIERFDWDAAGRHRFCRAPMQDETDRWQLIRYVDDTSQVGAFTDDDRAGRRQLVTQELAAQGRIDRDADGADLVDGNHEVTRRGCCPSAS
jgi:hypothetical protein